MNINIVDFARRGLAVGLAGVLALGMLTGCGSKDAETDGSADTTTTTTRTKGSTTPSTDTGSIVSSASVAGVDTKIQDFIRDRVGDEFSPSVVNSVTVSTDRDTGYDVTVGITWNKEDTASVAQATVGLYSDTLANEVATNLDQVEKLTVTWTLTQQNTMAQWNFVRNGNVLKLDTKQFGDVEGTTSLLDAGSTSENTGVTASGSTSQTAQQ